MKIGVNCVLRQQVAVVFPTWQTACSCPGSGGRLPKSEDVKSLVVDDNLPALDSRVPAPGSRRAPWTENSSDRWPNKHSLTCHAPSNLFFASSQWKDWVVKKVIFKHFFGYFLFLSSLVHSKLTQAKSFQRETWKETFKWMKCADRETFLKKC